MLFLGAGAVIISLHHEQDIFKMGGLRHRLPVVFWTFVIGSASLAALPLVTAGFYSKDLILWAAWASSATSPWLWAAGVLGASIYVCAVAHIPLVASLLARRRDEFKQNPKAATDLLAVGISPRDTSLDPTELAAWTATAEGSVLEFPL